MGICEAWVVAALADERSRSFSEPDEAVRERVAWVNARPFQRREGSRDSVFETLEKPELNPLPAKEYVWYEWRRCKVAPDYHVQCDYMRHSVPWRLVGRELDVRLDAMRVTAFDGGVAVAEHGRPYGARGQYSTKREHMPADQRGGASPWSREYFERGADAVGPATRLAIDSILDSRPIEPQAFVPCRNVLSLARGGRRDDLEAACEKIAEAGGAVSYTRVKNLMAAIRAEGSRRKEACEGPAPQQADRARHTGRTRGSDHYRREGRLLRCRPRTTSGSSRGGRWGPSGRGFARCARTRRTTG